MEAGSDQFRCLLAGLPELTVITSRDLRILEAFGAAPRNAAFEPRQLPGMSAMSLFGGGNPPRDGSPPPGPDLRRPGRVIVPVPGPERCTFWEVLIVRLDSDPEGGMGIRIRDLDPEAAEGDRRCLLERQLAEAQRWDAIGRLSSGIAHEITTPAQYVTDNLCFLKESWPDVSELLSRTAPAEAAHSLQAEPEPAEPAGPAFLLREVPQAIDQAYEGILRIGMITKSMREFAHCGSDEMAEADLHRVIQNTVTVTRNRWKHVAEVVLDLDPAASGVLCIASDIGQILLNLLVNAVDAVAERREQDGTRQPGRIMIRLRAAGRGARIEVEDDGPGIPRTLQARIFEPLFTTKPAGRGTGQGLPICKELIERRHGGRIEVESAAGKGSRFVLWIPGVPIGDEDAGALAEPGMVGGPEPSA